MPYKDPERNRQAKRESRKRYVPVVGTCQRGHTARRMKNGTCRVCHAELTLRKARKLFPTRAEPSHCEICGEAPSGKRRNLCLDHCHATNLFRGWLCGRCNSAIGLMRDNPVIMERATDYVRFMGPTDG